jgi:hypothetical protein
MMVNIDNNVPPPQKNTLEIFSGWKEIANYFGKGVRTVQRYERELRLPVHRPAGRSHAAVIATKAELDAWVAASAKRMLYRWPASQLNENGSKFLLIDSEIALTFAGIALGATSNEIKRRRTTRTARRAYDTIMRLRNHIELNDQDRERLDANLARLQSELQQLGAS